MSAKFVQNGDTIDYTPVAATPAGTLVKIGDKVGVTKLDIPAGALGAIEPRRGDVVTWHGRAFEVLSVGGEPCRRWSDPLHRARRVHTKLQAGAAL